MAVPQASYVPPSAMLQPRFAYTGHDLNGDGIPDALQGRHFAAPQRFAYTGLDFNGDGIPDALHAHAIPQTMPMGTMPMGTMPMGTMPMASMPMSSMPMATMPMQHVGAPRVTYTGVDLNGDGIPDALQGLGSRVFASPTLMSSTPRYVQSAVPVSHIKPGLPPVHTHVHPSMKAPLTQAAPPMAVPVQPMQPTAASTNLKAKADTLFAQLDRNHDGHVSKAEFIAALKSSSTMPELFHLPAQIREGAAHAQFENVWQSIDRDGDRQISLAELKSWFAQHQPGGAGVVQAQARQVTPFPYAAITNG
jgi:hypothetical protein